MINELRVPASGDIVQLYSPATDTYHVELSKITAILNRGIYGWIVEIVGLRIIEVLPVPDSRLFREIMSKERIFRAR